MGPLCVQSRSRARKCDHTTREDLENLKATSFKCVRCEERANDPAVPLEDVFTGLDVQFEAALSTRGTEV